MPVIDAELHYKSLTDYFKYLVTITAMGVGILVAVGLYITYRDMSSMRAEVKQNLSDVKGEIRQNMADVKGDTKQVVEGTRDQAKTAIDSTRDAASLQISQIREQSAAIALGEAQRRVENAFRTTNVETLVEDAARRQVGVVIERQAKGEVDRAMDSLQQDITMPGRLADAGAKMRIGMRSGWDQLFSLINSSTNENVLQRGKAIFESIATDYESYVKESMGGHSALETEYGEKLKELRSKPEFVQGMIARIRSGRDLHEVATSFLTLREVMGRPFKMFDIEAVEQWCAQHSQQCQNPKN